LTESEFVAKVVNTKKGSKYTSASSFKNKSNLAKSTYTDFSKKCNSLDDKNIIADTGWNLSKLRLNWSIV